MAHPLAEHPVHAITVEEALRMLDAEVFEDPQHLELLLGVLVEKPVKSTEHEDAKERLIEWLWPLGPRALRFEAPLVTPDGTSMPEPDISLAERSERTGHPTTARFVIEVAKTSLKVDTTVKPRLYASAGVPEYWVVDVVNHRVIVFRDPQSRGYNEMTIHQAPGMLAPLHLDVPPLDLAQLFR